MTRNARPAGTIPSMENIEGLVNLRMAARDALLESAKENGKPSAMAALSFFKERVFADKDLCWALLTSSPVELHTAMLMAELRKENAAARNDAGVESANDARRRAAQAKQQSNVVAPYTGGPSVSQVASMVASRKATVAAIYSAQETMIEGRQFHTVSYNEALTLLPILGRRAEHHSAEARRYRYQRRLLELVTSHAKPVDQNVSLADVVSAKVLAKIVAQVNEEEAALV